MDFYKYHALGNDYIVIDPSKNEVSLTEANIRRTLPTETFGVGSDGILYGPTFEGGGNFVENSQSRWQRGGKERQRHPHIFQVSL